MKTAIIVLLVVLVFGVALLIYFTYKGDAKKRLIVKLLDSLLFVTLGILSFIYANQADAYQRLYFILIISGAVLSFIGDLFLAISHKKIKNIHNKHFIIGGTAFFAAQLIYAGAFIYGAGYNWYLILLPILALVVIMFITQRPKFNVMSGKLKALVYGYAAIVVFTMSCSLGFVIKYGFANPLALVSLGGLCFLISDLLLLHKYFFKKQYRLVNVIYLSTYYAAQALYMLSIIFISID